VKVPVLGFAFDKYRRPEVARGLRLADSPLYDLGELRRGGIVALGQSFDRIDVKRVISR
jgi:hypothetical protein